MHFYKIFDPDADPREEKPAYLATMAKLREKIREIPSTFRPCYHVHLVNVKTDKASLEQLIATGRPIEDGEPLKKWRAKTRGGIRTGTEVL